MHASWTKPDVFRDVVLVGQPYAKPMKPQRATITLHGKVRTGAYKISRPDDAVFNAMDPVA